MNEFAEFTQQWRGGAERCTELNSLAQKKKQESGKLKNEGWMSLPPPGGDERFPLFIYGMIYRRRSQRPILSSTQDPALKQFESPGCGVLDWSSDTLPRLPQAPPSLFPFTWPPARLPT